MLRGSSDLHGWGDSNLYLRRSSKELILSIEHRAAPAGDDISLELTANGDALALSTITPTEAETAIALPAQDRLLEVMREAQGRMSTQQLRSRCRMPTQTVCNVLTELRTQGRVIQTDQGYQLKELPPPQAISFPDKPIGTQGNGNGKPQYQVLPLCL